METLSTGAPSERVGGEGGFGITSTPRWFLAEADIARVTSDNNSDAPEQGLAGVILFHSHGNLMR